MFHGVPLRRARGVVRDVNRQSRLIGPALQLAFPKSTTRAVSAAGVRLDEDRLGLRITSPALRALPVPQRVDAEMARFGGGADADVSFVTRRVVDAVRHGSTLGVLAKVVGVHFVRGPRPFAAGVLEIADQFLLFRIDTERRATCFLELPSLALDVTELPVSIRMRRTGESLHVDARRESEPSKQPSDGGAARFAQTCGQLTETAANELFSACRPAACFVFDQSLQLIAHAGVFFSMRGRPPPGKRTRSVGRAARSSSNSLRPLRIVSTLIPLTLAM